MDAVKRLKNQLLSKKAKMVSGKSRLYGQVSEKKYMQLYVRRMFMHAHPRMEPSASKPHKVERRSTRDYAQRMQKAWISG